jgi:hypothetical protein
VRSQPAQSCALLDASLAGLPCPAAWAHSDDGFGGRAPHLTRTAFELAGETKPAAALAMQGGKFTEARKLLLAAGEGGGLPGRVLKGATQQWQPGTQQCTW